MKQKPILEIKYKIFNLCGRYNKLFEVERSCTKQYFRVLFFSFEGERYELRISWICIGRRRGQLDSVCLYDSKNRRRQMIPTRIRALYEGMKNVQTERDVADLIVRGV